MNTAATNTFTRMVTSVRAAVPDRLLYKVASDPLIPVLLPIAAAGTAVVLFAGADRTDQAREGSAELSGGDGRRSASTERVDGATPNGGAYSIARYVDDDDQPVAREDATDVVITEYTASGEPLMVTSGRYDPAPSS